MRRQLVDRARRGDHDAFARLVDDSVDRLCTVAHLILRHPDHAQDAVQEALISAWRGLPSLRDAEALDAWLYRLTVRSCYRQARRERHRTQTELRAMPVAATNPLDDVAAQVVERDRLERELERLPIDQRAVIVIRFYLGCSVPEVAEILDIPLGTAKSRLSRGLLVLRDALGRERENPPRSVPVRSP